MKILSLLFLTIFLGKGCEKDKTTAIKDTMIEYTANTRGFYQNIIVRNQEAFITHDRSGKTTPQLVKITDEVWKTMIADFQKINLEKMPTLKSPTNKRFYDGAAIGTLKITHEGKIYESQSFDHGNPPAEIEKIVTLVTALVKKEE